MDKKTIIKFSKLSDVKKNNFIRKVSTIEDLNELMRQMRHASSLHFSWNKDSLMDFLENVEGIKYEIVCENENGVDNQLRIWWVQCEAMIGFYNEYQKDPAKTDYAEASAAIWEYVKENLVDKRPGSEWLSEVDEHAVPATRKPIVETWKCPYHNGRMCYEMIERIQ